MLTYVPQPEPQPISPLSCPVHAHPPVLMDQLLLPPAAPQTWIIPLPFSTPTTTSPSSDDGLFPLNLLQDLQVAQEPTLRSITLITPVHVHVPFAHIAIVYGDIPGQRVNALELVRCLQATSSQIIQRMNISVRPSGAVPAGYDLSLGNNEIWGLEPISLGGYSIIHLA